MSLIKDVIGTGGRFVGNLLIKSAARGVTNAGLPYYTVVFQDISGTIEAKKWDANADDDNLLTPGKVIYVEGEVINYKGKPQMKVLNLIPVPQGNVDMRDFLVSCPLSDNELQDLIYGYIDEITKPGLKAITKKIIDDYQDRYFSYPAAMTFHHSYHGGIAYHSLSVLKLALAIASQYAFLDKDYLIAGAILHDIGKTIELSGEVATSYTLEGKMVGHISIGAGIVSSYAKLVDINEEEKMVLTHMILSHHEKPEYGSPVAPQTAEAVVLHFADDIDAKMDMLSSALNDVKEGDYTVKLAAFENKSFFKTHK